MNGLILLIPFLLIRFFLLSKINNEGVIRAAHFAPMEGNEKIAYWIYQITNLTIFVYLCFLSVDIDEIKIFVLGILLYLLGLIICIFSIVDFASPSKNGLNSSGIYRYSRNPMYISYFVLFIGCSLLTNSLSLFLITLVFQISAHWVILAEERWCIEKFGQSYKDYMKKVRRYI